jgi:hypothetical protein
VKAREVSKGRFVCSICTPFDPCTGKRLKSRYSQSPERDARNSMFFVSNGLPSSHAKCRAIASSALTRTHTPHRRNFLLGGSAASLPVDLLTSANPAMAAIESLGLTDVEKRGSKSRSNRLPLMLYKGLNAPFWTQEQPVTL